VGGVTGVSGPADATSRPRSAVVVGVDGSGRTHRLRAIAASAPGACWVPPGTDGAGLEQLLADAHRTGALVVVDDAHLLGPDALTPLVAAARGGRPLAMARRPTITLPALADLDDAIAADGSVDVIGALAPATLAQLLAAATGQAPDAAEVARLHAVSGGLAAVAAALAQAGGDPTPADLRARVQRRLARLPAPVVRVARLLALRLDLPDGVLAVAADVDLDTLAEAARELREVGFLVPPGEGMVPAIAALLVDELSPAELRRVHDAVAHGLRATGGDVVAAAERLRAARARTPAAADAFLEAGERLRFTDPAAALGWFADALDAGLAPALAAAGQAEAGVLLGLDVQTEPPPGATDGVRARLLVAQGVAAAQQGRAERAGQLLAGTCATLACVPLASTGRPLPAPSALAADAVPAGVRLLAEAMQWIADPAAALPALIEAAEAVQASRPSLLLPDSPHAVGAVLAVTVADAATAEHLLREAVAAQVGGPAGVRRHRLLLAWARMRSGRFDTAVTELAATDAAALPGRDRLLVSALQAGLARRSGDIARLRDAWTTAEQLLARRAVDLLQVEPLEELLVAAARLRRPQRVEPVVQALQEVVDRLGHPPAWSVTLDWLRLQLAVAVDDVTGTGELADRLDAVTGTGPRQLAQQRAGRCWAQVLRGEVDDAALAAAVDALAAAELPWEASRLAGQAAIRCNDAALARRLLERARDLSGPDALVYDDATPGSPSRGAASGGSTAGGAVAAGSAAGRPAASGLSDREVEVAQLVLDGRTHREIGAQLFLSPKTVEHHVARIRTKLGATTRADFQAALRRVLGTDARPPPQRPPQEPPQQPG
jgi:DNA-binding CsgD family transcriptional regulator